MIERTRASGRRPARLVPCCALVCVGFVIAASAPPPAASGTGKIRRMCGTDMTSAPHETGDYLNIVANDEGEIPIVFHVVRDGKGLGGYDPGEGVTVEEALAESVEHLHIFFPESPEGAFRTFRFRLEAVFDGVTENYLRSDRFICIAEDEISEIKELYGIDGKLNVFLVDELIWKEEPVCGIASCPGSNAQGIIMDWTCLREAGEPTSVLAHEIGHYFYLYHPHETDFGPELVRRDSANCEWRGDKLCDTPADPKLGYENVDTLTCAYIGIERDPEGARYDPDVKNVMSYAPERCCEYFSAGQLARMTMAFDHEMPGMVAKPVSPAVAVRAYPNPIFPGATPATIDFYDLPIGFAEAHIGVYDVSGRLVRTIYDGYIDKLDAYGRFRWHADDNAGRFVGRGIYFIAVRLNFGKAKPSIGGAKISVLK